MPLNLPKPCRILVYGKDARSDAIARACCSSGHEAELYTYSEYNNPGFLALSKRFYRGSLTNINEMQRCAAEVRPNLVLVGPEEPLCVGIVDVLEGMGIPCFGPRKQLAQIETSKSWARNLLTEQGIPGNPPYEVFRSIDGLGDYLAELGEFAVKPDGLTGGKGVRLSGEHLSSQRAAVDYAAKLLKEHGSVVVERKLEGEEFSLQTITDGHRFVHCPLVQDHKRAFEGDTGPNTGGMGSYSSEDLSLPFLESSDVERARSINERVIRALNERCESPYRGVLYGGFIATREGVRLIEYNARFADPEGMNIIPIMDADFLEVCYSCAVGELQPETVNFHRKATVCKYVVPNGYPDAPVHGRRISLPAKLSENDNLRMYYAGVDQREDGMYLTGSRGLAFVGIDDTLSGAEALAEEAASSVQGPVMHRKDIGKAALISRRIRHMAEIRGVSTENSKLVAQ